MIKLLLKNIYWLIPMIVVCIGLGVLFWDNYLQVTEPPSNNWSDALFINKTTTKHLHHVKQETDNTHVIPHIENDKIRFNQYHKDFSLKKENTYTAKKDKGLKFYINKDHFYYFSKQTIYNKNHTKIQDKVDDFFPLSDTILFTKKNVLFEFDPETEKTNKILSLDKEHNIITDTNTAPYVIIYKVNHKNELTFEAYQINNHKLLTTFKFPMKQGQEVHDISFTIKKEKIALSLQTKPRDVLGSHDFSTYFVTSDWSNMHHAPLDKVVLEDPASNQSLHEISNVSPRLIEGEPHFLFQAMGYTKTLVRDREGFNIYEAIFSNENHPHVKRKTNTPSASLKPIWVDNRSIAWLEPNKETYDMYIASSDKEVISKANTFNKDYFIRAVGKTIMGLVTATLMILPSLIWLIWPILFIFLLHVFWGRFLDQQQHWIYYTGISIYIGAAFIFQNILFTETVYMGAPKFLTFTGSPYFYISIFALVSFFSIRLAPHFKDWDVTFKILCFVGIHLFITITFFGPYLI